MASAISVPNVIGLFGHTDLSDRIQTGHALTHKNLKPSELRDNFFGPRSLVRYDNPPFYLT